MLQTLLTKPLHHTTRARAMPRELVRLRRQHLKRRRRNSSLLNHEIEGGQRARHRGRVLPQAAETTDVAITRIRTGPDPSKAYGSTRLSGSASIKSGRH